MNSQDFRNLQEAYSEVYESEQLDEMPYQIYGPDPGRSSDSERIKLGKPYKKRNTAQKKADNLDQEIGGYRHSVRKVDESIDIFDCIIEYLADEIEIDESATPGKPAERVGALININIPDDEREAARKRTLDKAAKAKAMREKIKESVRLKIGENILEGNLDPIIANSARRNDAVQSALAANPGAFRRAMKKVVDERGVPERDPDTILSDSEKVKYRKKTKTMNSEKK